MRPVSRKADDTSALLKRVKKTGDLFAPVLTLKQKLPSLTALTKTFGE